MAARVFLLSILFTEVLRPACLAGVRGVSVGVRGLNTSKAEILELERSGGLGIRLETEPSGNVVVGRKGVTLRCSAGANQNVSWFRNGVAAPPCGLVGCMQQPNGSLRIFKMVQKRGGRGNKNSSNYKIQRLETYRCVAKNAIGSLRSSPALLHLADLSNEFDESPQDVIVQEGEVAKLSCHIRSIPFPPNVTWQHGGEPLSNNETKYVMISPGVLYINATKLSDAGSYRCVATNDFLRKTRKSKEANLRVIKKPESKESDVPILLFPQISYNYQLVIGSDLTLACVSSGFPILVNWTFISKSQGKPAVLLSNSTGSLVILKLKKLGISNAGVYRCSVKGSGTIFQIQSITVDVLVPPTFIKKPVHQISPNGMTARFECQAQGYPMPQIYWLKDSVNFTTAPRKKINVKNNNTMELAIASTVPSDSGIYQCVAVNTAGEVWAAGRLQVTMSPQSPPVPTSLHCQPLSPDKIFLSWELPETAATSVVQLYITVHYAVVMDPTEPGSSREDTALPDENSSFIEIRKLKPFTNYTMYVRTWNKFGGSIQSTTVQCSTAASGTGNNDAKLYVTNKLVPIAAPAIKVEAISSTKLNVSWQPLSVKEARGHIVEYKLQWRLPHHSSSKIIKLSSAITQYILTDLNPDTRYELRVLARTKQGWPVNDLQFNWTSVAMPSTDPTQPPSLVNIEATSVNASVIKVKWKINEEVSKLVNSFDSWQLNYKKTGEKNSSEIILPKNSTKHLFTNLEADVLYTIVLCMISSGEPLMCFPTQLDSNRLGNDHTVNNLEGDPVSSTSINITWSAVPSDFEHCYEVCYNAVIFSDSELPKCFNTTNVTVTVRNLKPFTLYQFRVRLLYNNSEEGGNSYSEIIECYTNENDRLNIPSKIFPVVQLLKIVPGAVKEVRWGKSNVTEIYVGWEKMSTINGTISNYTVYYIDGPASTPIEYWKNLTVPGNTTTAHLPGLAPNTRYFVEVRAATNAGYGKPSDRIMIQTPKYFTDLPIGESPSPPTKPITDQSLGIIVGVSISTCCIIICLSSIYCRKKWETTQTPRESPQSLKDRVVLRNGNGCCIERNLGSATQRVPTVTATNEIELTALCPPSPKATEFHSCRSNGVVESQAKEPLLTSWDTNGDNKDLNITENPQYKRRGSSGSNRQPEQELDATRLTTLNYTLASSDSGSNNNFESLDSLSSLRAPSTPVLVVGPNG